MKDKTVHLKIADERGKSKNHAKKHKRNNLNIMMDVRELNDSEETKEEVIEFDIHEVRDDD